MSRLSAARVAVSEKRKFSDFDSAMAEDSSFNNKKRTASQQHRHSVKLRFSDDHHAVLKDRHDHYRLYTASSKLVPQETTTMKSFDDSKNLRAEKLKIRFAVTINKAREAMDLPPMKLDAQETEICTKPTCDPRKRPAPLRVNVKPMKTTVNADVSKSSMQFQCGHTSLKLASQETDTRVSRKEDIERERRAAREKIEAMKTVDFPDNLGAMLEMERMLGRSWTQFQYHS